MQHRHRQGRDGGDDPGAVRQQPRAAGGRDSQLRHYQAGGAGAGGLAAVLAGARGGDGGSDYWKGPFCRLEAGGFDCVLADARQVWHLPGRPKHDPGDPKWLVVCFERGAVTPCFVATGEFRVIWLHTLCRRDLTEERAWEKDTAMVNSSASRQAGRRARDFDPIECFRE